ncbi:MAG: thioredoxin family protein [Solirubrobacteraceae bacterium]
MQGIPLLLLVRDGREVDRLVGAVPPATLRAALEQHLGARLSAAERAVLAAWGCGERGIGLCVLGVAPIHSATSGGFPRRSGAYGAMAHASDSP